MARAKSPKAQVQIWLRSLHIYSSMGTLLLVLFFSLSGILLNHPEWVPAGVERNSEVDGQVSTAWLTTKNTDWLHIVEEVRAKHELKGRAAEFQNDGEEATFVYRAPGLESNVVISVDSGKYTVNTNAQGLLAVIGDLHRGHNTGGGWKWIIDLSAVFLVFISATGFGILIYLKKHRRQALLTLLAGSLVTALAIWRLA